MKKIIFIAFIVLFSGCFTDHGMDKVYTYHGEKTQRLDEKYPNYPSIQCTSTAIGGTINTYCN